MGSPNGGLTRRGLLLGVLGSVAVAALRPKALFAATRKARVVRVESARVWQGTARDVTVIAAMLDKGLIALSGAATPQQAWRHYFKPGMRVGLKINLLGRPLLYTAPEVTEAVAAGVIAAGVKPGDVIVWDRWRDHFGPTAYKFGTGKHGEAIVSGGEYHPTIALHGSTGIAPIDRIPVERTDVTVSLPLLKDHGVSGVTLALKNIAFGCYDHHAAAHDNGCDPFISEAYQHFVATTKVPVIILDATRACFEGGPRPSDRSRIWNENAIYFATDPVALDTVCRKVIVDKRAAAGLPDRTRQSKHIETAARLGLGTNDPNQIELVTLRV
ncbi:MAG: DUF362 domain-containing protein [Thermoanaerobaculales bacterium]